MSTANARKILDAIPVRVEQSSGNISPLLHEIRHALTLLLNVGASTSIDLKSIPLAPGEEERILEALGRGEVRATVTTSGTSDILETGFPGVWLITHLGEQGEVQARLIEITAFPEILRADTSDITAGLGRLKHLLGSQ